MTIDTTKAAEYLRSQFMPADRAHDVGALMALSILLLALAEEKCKVETLTKRIAELEARPHLALVDSRPADSEWPGKEGYPR